MEAAIRTAAERAAGEVYELVQAAALEAARDAVRKALVELVGAGPAVPDVDVQDRVTRTEAARRLGVTPQRIIRLEQKGAVSSERTEDGRVDVRRSEVRDAVEVSGRVQARARVGRSA